MTKKRPYSREFPARGYDENKDGKVRISIQFDRETFDLISEAAQAMGSNFNATIRRLLTRALK